MYPKILRTVVRDYYHRNKCTIREISKRFNISKSTVGRWIINNYQLRKHKYNRSFLSTTIKDILLDLPFVTLISIQKFIHSKCNYMLSISYISKIVRNLGYSYKKVSTKFHGGDMNKLALQQNEFREAIKNVSNEDCICIDESGFMTNEINKYGRSLKGTRLYNYTKSNYKKYSLVMAITNNGILGYDIYETNINSSSFLSFMTNKVLPYANNKYIIMDNIRFHKTETILDTIKEYNATPLFIPPYSPQFNSIEYVFSIMKSKYRQLNTNENSKALIKSIIRNLKNNDFNNIYNHIRKI